MNDTYEALLKELNIDSAIIDCAAGRIPSPLVSMISPAEWYCFPPALCPVWCDPSLPYYLGIWKHWFNPRPTTFVGYYVESAKAYEVACTSQQLLAHFIMSAIIIHDGVTPAIERFASAVGISNVLEMNDVSLKTGDDPLGYSAIAQFKSNLPLASVADPNHYKGGFPTGIFSGSSEWWRESTALEVSDDVLESWPDSVLKPTWFRPGSRKAAFDTSFAARDFHGAWLILNSPGWSISDAKVSLFQLAAVANDSTFSLLAEAWSSVAEDRSGGY